MAAVVLSEHPKGIRVQSDAWVIEHALEFGGAWSSVVLTHGSGKNLLQRPLSSALRFVSPDAASDLGAFTSFNEHSEKAPRLKIEPSTSGIAAVVAEGTLTDAKGNTVPVGYRRRTEYHDDGQIWTTLDLMSDSGCPDVVELRAIDLGLRLGFSDAFVRFHPSQAGGADLLGGRGWFDLTAPGTSFLSRFTPLQVCCLERGGEGIDLFPGSELSAWDTAVRQPGLGDYSISQTQSGISIHLSPYCVAYRRIKTTLKGHVSFRLGIGLPNLAPHRTRPALNATTLSGPPWSSDEQLAGLARQGVKLLRFENDFSERGEFWRAGVHPPFDPAGMSELRRVIDSAHRLGMKIVAALSLHELHPGAPAFAGHAREWMHAAGPSLDIIHTYRGSGESGALMCLKSGWVDHCKAAAATILAELPWDGLFLKQAASYPCCHPGHGHAPYHSDIEQLLYVIGEIRARIGAEKLLLLDLAGAPNLIAENSADAVFVNDAESAIVPLYAARLKLS